MAVSEDLSRRQFVVLAASCAAACACGVTMAADAADTGKVDVGPVSDYPKEGIYDQYIKTGKVIVYRESGRMYASTAVCPHKGAVMIVRGDEVYCKRHGSTFDAQGSVTHGPAQNSLEHYAIALDDKNHLIVDRSKSFTEKNWDDPASFVKIN